MPFASPGAFAESNDAKYCDDLSDKYERLVTEGDGRDAQATPVDVGVAKDKCQSDPTWAIPMLEKALNRAKIPLPPRG
jgi:hypothetical protein